MPTVSVLNNYSLPVTQAEVERGEKPDHHLYGINHFARYGYEVRHVPFARSPRLQRLERWLARSRLPLGNLDQQWSCWQDLANADIIYAPCQTQTHLLSYLRALGVLQTPIVCLAHHPLNPPSRFAAARSPLVRWSVRGTDAFPSLSAGVAAEVNRLADQPHKSQMLPWGPDLQFYPRATGPGRGAIASGRTGRDFVTFGRAASRTTMPAQIICARWALQPEFAEFASNVQVLDQPPVGYLTYPHLVAMFARARVLAIPLSPGPALAGLTSLADALGVGRPVIVTRHPLLDLDVEAAGIGRWVAPGDIDGWREALQWFEDNPEEANFMGDRARQLAEDEWNSAQFARRIIALMDRLLGRTSPPEVGSR